MPIDMILPKTTAWLACPATPQQTDAYWQAVTPWREAGIELVLCPSGAGVEPPWQKLQSGRPWQGLVLWPGAHSDRLRQQAQALGIEVRCLSTEPPWGLQAWLGA